MSAGRDGSYKKEGRWLIEKCLRSEEWERMRAEQRRGIREKDKIPVPEKENQREIENFGGEAEAVEETEAETMTLPRSRRQGLLQCTAVESSGTTTTEQVHLIVWDNTHEPAWGIYTEKDSEAMGIGGVGDGTHVHFCHLQNWESKTDEFKFC